MKKFNLAVAFAAVATMAVASSASASVARYQEQSGTFTVQLVERPELVHTFTVVVNPCDGSFTGTGVSEQGNQVIETVEGTFIDGQLDFLATYTDVEYAWGTTSPDTVMDTNGSVFHVTVTPNLVSSNWKNHGEYVKANGGGADAAHSCIGMPIK